jgi:uncharacterized caspase-like protein
MRSAALLIGMNYAGDEALEGCIRDVEATAAWLRGAGVDDITLVTDRDRPDDCTLAGILRVLSDAVRRTWSDRLELLWIHFSGHGASVSEGAFRRDEEDGRDEGWVPTNAALVGVVRDDAIADVLKMAWPGTRVVVVSDACHSGSICDLAYEWPNALRESPVHRAEGLAHGNVVLLSGCADNQTSADTARGGALTTTLLELLREPKARDDVFVLVTSMRQRLHARGFSQVPALSATVDLTQQPALFPDHPECVRLEVPTDAQPPSTLHIAASTTRAACCNCCCVM